jgi:hypothetical protein
VSDPTLDQLNLDRAESAYDEQCWREDRDELHGHTRSAMSFDEFVKDEGRRRAASMQFDTPQKSGPVVPKQRGAA